MRLPGVPDNIAGLEGPIAIGQFLAWGLDGILLMQVLFYYFTFPNDNRPIKWLVWSVFIMDIITSALGTVFAYNSLASGWGDLDVLYRIPWVIPPMPIVCGFIASAVQIFYCWRIWSLSHKPYVPAFLALVSMTQCVAATYVGIHLIFIGDWRQLAENLIPAAIWLIGSAFCDFCITSCLVYLLFQQRKDATNRHTSSMINKIITYTIETGSIPAINALFQLILFFASTDTNVSLIFFFILAELYSNSMMANLNARKVIFSAFPSGINTWEKSTSIPNGSGTASIPNDSGTSSA